jgi:hypothetical protein
MEETLLRLKFVGLLLPLSPIPYPNIVNHTVTTVQCRTGEEDDPIGNRIESQRHSNHPGGGEPLEFHPSNLRHPKSRFHQGSTGQPDLHTSPLYHEQHHRPSHAEIERPEGYLAPFESNQSHSKPKYQQ